MLILIFRHMLHIGNHCTKFNTASERVAVLYRGNNGSWLEIAHEAVSRIKALGIAIEVQTFSDCNP